MDAAEEASAKSVFPPLSCLIQRLLKSLIAVETLPRRGFTLKQPRRV